MDSPEIQLIGELCEAAAVLVDFPSPLRTVRMHANAIAHMRERRPERDVQFALRHLREAITRPRMIGQEVKDVRRYRLILVFEQGPSLHVSLKFVPAADSASRDDELWVSSAFPVSRTLTRLRNKATLWWIVE